MRAVFHPARTKSLAGSARRVKLQRLGIEANAAASPPAPATIAVKSSARIASSAFSQASSRQRPSMRTTCARPAPLPRCPLAAVFATDRGRLAGGPCALWRGGQHDGVMAAKSAPNATIDRNDRPHQNKTCGWPAQRGCCAHAGQGTCRHRSDGSGACQATG